MVATPRMTIPTQLVLQGLLEVGEAYGAQLGSALHLPSGTVHPILARLEGLAWVESRWEDIDPSREGRPARRYYRLTPTGRRQASAALERAARHVRLVPRPRPAGGA
jgi:PadR family transcriptional regulator, regulatory protein PadR